ncbi:MAG: hypothetical protein OEX01_09020 [Candidatus Bathyarchaeota archaeon]|nr:hypothetical protein [Candidatus Bathyarchaeota archaeon]
MKVELKSLQNRRKELTKELKLLSEKEEVLLAKTRVLKGMLKIRRKTEKPKQFEKAREKLEALEGFVEKKNWSKDFDFRAHLVTPIPRGNRLVTTGGTSISRNDSKLNRVRLKRNATFSWSYKKLP